MNIMEISKSKSQHKNREDGVVFESAALILPILIMFVLGAFDIFRLMANRSIVMHEMASLLQDYKMNPAAVNLEQLKEKAGFGLIDLNNDNSCIVVTAHGTLNEAYEATKTHTCKTESINQITTSKPYFAVTTKYKHESLFAPIIYGATNNGRTISMNEVLYVNLVKCLENQIMVSDGNGGMKCSENIEDVMDSIDQLKNGLTKLGEDLEKLEEKVDEEDERINKRRIDDLEKDLTELNKDLQDFKSMTTQQLARLEQQLNSLASQVLGLQNNVNNLWAHISALYNLHNAQQNDINAKYHWHEVRFADVYHHIGNLWWWIGHLQNQINDINWRGWRHCYALHFHHWPGHHGVVGYSFCHNGYYIANMHWEFFLSGITDTHAAPEVHVIECCRP